MTPDSRSYERVAALPDAPSAAAGPDPASPDGSLLGLAASIIERRKRIGTYALIAATVCVGIAGLLPAEYTASAAILAQSSGSSSPLSHLSGLAAQLGVNLGGAQEGPTPETYADLLQSDNVLRPVADAVYRYSRGGGDEQATLADFLEFRSGAQPTRRGKAILKLRKIVSITPDDPSGLVQLSITTRSATVSQQVLANMLTTLDTINGRLQQTRATVEETFIQSRLISEGEDLKQAEDRMRDFLAHNRNYTTDPSLQLQHDNLDRDLQLRATVFTTLAQGLEQLRIDAARDTPRLTVLESPLVADMRDPTNFTLLAIIGTVIGLLTGVAEVLIREGAAGVGGRDPASYSRFRAAAASVTDDLRRLIPLRSRRRGSALDSESGA